MQASGPEQLVALVGQRGQSNAGAGAEQRRVHGTCKVKVCCTFSAWKGRARVPAPPCDTTTLHCGNSHECATVPAKFMTLGGGEGGESHP
jgi:hypothetical protein